MLALMVMLPGHVRGKPLPAVVIVVKCSSLKNMSTGQPDRYNLTCFACARIMLGTNPFVGHLSVCVRGNWSNWALCRPEHIYIRLAAGFRCARSNYEQ